jgi:hypothetical protein
MALTSSLAQSARVLWDPVDGVPDAVGQRRWGVPLLLLMLASVFGGVAAASRLDVAPTVMQQLQMTGSLANMSDQDLAEKITSAQHLAIVGGVAKGLFLIPLLLLGATIAVKFAAWLIGRSTPFKACLSVVAVAMMPLVVYQLAFGVVALWQLSLSPMQLPMLLPSSLAAISHNPKLVHALSGLDFFSLWGTALLGLGFAKASGMSRARSLIFAFVLYGCWVGVAHIGLPALMAQGAGHGGMHGGHHP